nr:hypothetical protein [Tanacetum cinerariifolium]
IDHVSSEEVTEPLPQIPSLPLPIPSPPPDSPTHIEISESCLPLRKRQRFASHTPSQEVGESSTVGAARQNESTIARDDPYSLVREELYGFFDREVTEPLPQIPSPPLPIPSPPPDSPTHIEISESCLPLRKRQRFASHTPSQEVGESSTVGAARQNESTIARDDPYSLVREELYGFFDRDELVGASEEIAPTTLQGVNKRVTDLSTIIEQETTIMYGIMEEAQDSRSQLRGRVNLLYRDRPVQRHLVVMVEKEARMAREAWGLSMDASDNARSDVMSLRTTIGAQHMMILDLQATDHRRQGVIKELLAADHKRQVQLTKALRVVLIYLVLLTNEVIRPGLNISLRPILGVLQIGIKSQVMSSDSHATVTYTSMSSYEVTIKPDMEPEENDGDDEKSEGDSIDYSTSEEDNDANDDGDDLLEDDADNKDDEESSDNHGLLPVMRGPY